MYDIYFYEAFEEEIEALKRFLPPTIQAGFCSRTIQESDHSECPARFLSIRTQSTIPDTWFSSLEALLSRSTGYDHIQRLAVFSERSVKFGYLPLYCSRAVAEQAMLMWMFLLRRLPKQIRQFHSFHRDGLMGQECRGKTLVVVGVGNIGSEILKLGKAMGMKCYGVDIVERFEGVHYVDLEEILPECDVLVCAMNLTMQNHDYFTAKSLKRIKRGSIFINVARGEMSPSLELKKLLDGGTLGGIGLDVYNREKLVAAHLRGHYKTEDHEVSATLQLCQGENVLCTPHNSFNTAEATNRKAEQSVRQVINWLHDRAFLWSVPGLSDSEYK